MKIIFMGTPQFGAPCLQALLESKHQVTAVFCQPDRRQGRGQKMQFGPIKALALQHDIAVHQPTSLQGEVYLELFAGADVVVVVAYGLLLPKQYLFASKYGCLNIHASLLPRWRGAAPIQRAIASGDTVTGVCLMQMEEGLDTGPVFAKKSCDISKLDTSLSLADKLSHLSVDLLLDWLSAPTLQAKPQVNSQAVYAKKISKQEAKINWQMSNQDIFNLLRAFQPWPGLYFEHNGVNVKVHALSVVEKLEGEIGEVVVVNDQELLIKTGKGAVSIDSLQLPNRQKVIWADFYRGQADFFNLHDRL